MLGIEKLFSKGKKVVGLDIGSTQIKLVEIVDTSNGYFLSNFAQKPLESNIIENGLIKNQEALAKSIKEIFNNSGCKTKNVVTALSGHSVIIKKANFRNIEEDQLRELIIDEAENYMPINDIKEVNFDFHVIGESEFNKEQIDILIVAAKKDIINSYKDVIEKDGRHLMVMDVDSFALETAYEENYNFDEDDVVVLINMGSSITNINVVRGGESVFTRNFLQGGNSITEALMEKLGVLYEDAEKMKCEGIPENESFQDELLSYAEPIFIELERSIDYFSSTLGGPYIKQVIVSGGCAKIQGIVDILADRLHCDVEIFNPFNNITYDKKVFNKAFIKDISSVAALGVGLALRRISDK